MTTSIHAVVKESITEDQYCTNYDPYLYTLTSAKYGIDLECIVEPEENVGCTAALSNTWTFN